VEDGHRGVRLPGSRVDIVDDSTSIHGFSFRRFAFPNVVGWADLREKAH